MSAATGPVRSATLMAALAVAVGALAYVLPHDGCGATALQSVGVIHTSHGDIAVRLQDQMVPATVERFVGLAQAGWYNGTHIDRIVKDVDIQGGATAADGTLAALQDELHPALRHDRAGILSMANAGPNSAQAAFFITSAAAPGLDDRFAAFGEVVCGLDVVNTIASLDIDGATFGPPREPVAITSIDIVAATGAPSNAHGTPMLHAWTEEKAATPQVPAVFPVVVRNLGDVRDDFVLRAVAPAGWTVLLEHEAVSLPAQWSWVVLVTAQPSPDAQPGPLVVHAGSIAQPAVSASLTLRVSTGVFGSVPSEGQHVTLEYVGMTPDGRVFGTTHAIEGLEGRTMSSVFSAPDVVPYSYRVGSGVVPGFDDLVQATALGQSNAGRVAAADGYAMQSGSAGLLAGRDLVFEVKVTSVT